MVDQDSTTVQLKRVLSLPQVVLYGLGTTIGAGIYALLGEIAEVSGYMAPWAFVTAALLALLTALSFARMVARYPKAAGAALYIQQGFRSKQLALLCGLLVIAAGIVSSAALLNGLVGYAQDFFPIQPAIIILFTGALIATVASRGINLSAWVIALITLVEVGGLTWATVLASDVVIESWPPAADMSPSNLLASGPMILSGAVLAFYAYIGFEDMVEIAEEVKEVRYTLPMGILITLGLSTLLYLMLVASATLAVGPDFLARSSAPLTDLVAALSNTNPLVMSVIAAFAILNGALIQLIMASRVLYGLASGKLIPEQLASVNKTTQTPLIATFLAAALTITLSLIGSLDQLARLTSLIILVIFGLVNLSLAADEQRQRHPHRLIQIQGGLGAAVCLGLALIAFFEIVND